MKLPRSSYELRQQTFHGGAHQIENARCIACPPAVIGVIDAIIHVRWRQQTGVRLAKELKSQCAEYRSHHNGAVAESNARECSWTTKGYGRLEFAMGGVRPNADFKRIGDCK